MQRLKRNGIAVEHAAETFSDGASAVAAHDNDGVEQATGDAGPHQAAHGVVFDEIFVITFEPERISARKKCYRSGVRTLQQCSGGRGPDGGGGAHVLRLFFFTYSIMRSTRTALAASAAASTLLLPLLPPLPLLL
jgi:hypothetical protein